MRVIAHDYIDPDRFNNRAVSIPLTVDSTKISYRRNYNQTRYSYPKSSTQWHTASVQQLAYYDTNQSVENQGSQVTTGGVQRHCLVEGMENLIFNVNTYLANDNIQSTFGNSLSTSAYAREVRRFLDVTAPYPWIYYQSQLQIPDSTEAVLNNVQSRGQIADENYLENLIFVKATAYFTVTFRGSDAARPYRQQQVRVITNTAENTPLKNDLFRWFGLLTPGLLANKTLYTQLTEQTYVTGVLEDDPGPRKQEGAIIRPTEDQIQRIRQALTQQATVTNTTQYVNLVRNHLATHTHMQLNAAWEEFLQVVSATSSKDIKLDYSKYFADIRTYPCPTASMLNARSTDEMYGYGAMYAPYIPGNFGLFTTSSMLSSTDVKMNNAFGLYLRNIYQSVMTDMLSTGQPFAVLTPITTRNLFAYQSTRANIAPQQCVFYNSLGTFLQTRAFTSPYDMGKTYTDSGAQIVHNTGFFELPRIVAITKPTLVYETSEVDGSQITSQSVVGPGSLILFPDERNMREIVKAHTRGTYVGNFQAMTGFYNQLPRPEQPYGPGGSPVTTAVNADSSEDIFYIFTLVDPTDYSSRTSQKPHIVKANTPLRWLWLLRILSWLLLFVKNIIDGYIERRERRIVRGTNASAAPRIVYGGASDYDDVFVVQRQFQSTSARFQDIYSQVQDKS